MKVCLSTSAISLVFALIGFDCRDKAATAAGCCMHSSLTALFQPQTNAVTVAVSQHLVTPSQHSSLSRSVGVSWDNVPGVTADQCPLHCSGHQSSCPQCVSAQRQVRTGQWLHSASLGSVHRHSPRPGGAVTTLGGKC